MDNPPDLSKARMETPQGAYCGLCKKENTFVDDAGFFWWFPRIDLARTYNDTGYQMEKRDSLAKKLMAIKNKPGADILVEDIDSISLSVAVCEECWDILGLTTSER